MAQLYDAVLDDCPQCRQELLTYLCRDSSTAGVLVGWACLIASETYGGLPEALLEESERSDAPFQPSAEFRILASEYDDMGMGPSGMYAACDALTDDERLQAAGTALEIVVGLADLGVDFLYQ